MGLAFKRGEIGDCDAGFGCGGGGGVRARWRIGLREETGWHLSLIRDIHAYVALQAFFISFPIMGNLDF